MNFIDTHAHLDFPQFRNDLPDVFLRAKEAGVFRIINIGVNVETSRSSVQLANEHEFLYAACGIHPSDIACFSQDAVNEIRDLISNNPKVVAIGEIGLDYFRMKFSRQQQMEVFRAFLQLATEVRGGDFPVIVHCRDAYDDTLSILNEFHLSRVVFHCYSGDLAFAERLWEKGMYTSFTGIVTYPNAKNVQEVARHAPQDKFFFETDCPYLAPQSHRGERNEPSFVSDIAAKVAELRGVSLEIVVRQANENAGKFFSLSS